MIRLGKEKDSLLVVNDQRGCPTYAKDLANTCLALLDKEWNPNQRVYHFSNSGEITWYDFAKKIMELTGSNCEISPVPSSEFPTPAKRPSYSVMDTSDLKKDFGIESRNWKFALQECISQLWGWQSHFFHWILVILHPKRGSLDEKRVKDANWNTNALRIVQF